MLICCSLPDYGNNIVASFPTFENHPYPLPVSTPPILIVNSRNID